MLGTDNKDGLSVGGMNEINANEKKERKTLPVNLLSNVFYELIVKFERPITGENSVFLPSNSYAKMAREIYSFFQKKN